MKSPKKFIIALILNFLFRLLESAVYSFMNVETTRADTIVALIQLKAISCRLSNDELFTVFNLEQVSINAPNIWPPNPKCSKNV